MQSVVPRGMVAIAIASNVDVVVDQADESCGKMMRNGGFKNLGYLGFQSVVRVFEMSVLPCTKKQINIVNPIIWTECYLASLENWILPNKNKNNRNKRNPPTVCVELKLSGVAASYPSTNAAISGKPAKTTINVACIWSQRAGRR